MKKAFPTHLDPDTFTVNDFKDNECEAYYWFGFFAGRSGQDTKNADPVEEVADVDNRRVSKPLCEEAEYVAFDCETSGLSGNDAAIQVAIVFCRKDGSVMGTYNKLWKLPEGKRVTAASTKIHGITNRKLQEEGVDARPELAKLERMFSRMLARGKRLVAHNSGFDCRMLRQTAFMHGYDQWSLDHSDVFCTMKSSKPICGLVSSRTGNPKAPSNAELYKYFFLEYPNVPLHDAVADCRVTAKSYQRGRERGLW